jgi:hypothetical protein
MDLSSSALSSLLYTPTLTSPPRGWECGPPPARRLRHLAKYIYSTFLFKAVWRGLALFMNLFAQFIKLNIGCIRPTHLLIVTSL